MRFFLFFCFFSVFSPFFVFFFFFFFFFLCFFCVFFLGRGGGGFLFFCASIPSPCISNLCLRKKVDGTRNVALESARRQSSSQSGTRHCVHGHAADFMWWKTFRVPSRSSVQTRACKISSSVTLRRERLSRASSESTVRHCDATCVEKHPEQNECL